MLFESPLRHLVLSPEAAHILGWELVSVVTHALEIRPTSASESNFHYGSSNRKCTRAITIPLFSTKRPDRNRYPVGIDSILLF
jgi:hypothetical protein